jgi:hypothetical protein
MKELTDFELLHINGGEVSNARKAGRAFGEFLGLCTAVAIFIADAAVDLFKS